MDQSRLAAPDPPRISLVTGRARRIAPLLLAGLGWVCILGSISYGQTPYPGTRPLTWEGDLAARLVDGVDRFLLRKLDESIQQRASLWQRDLSSPDKYRESVRLKRLRLAHILGVRDVRVHPVRMELAGTVSTPARIGEGQGYEIFKVRWPVLEPGVEGEGLLLVPISGPPLADIVALPDADQTPEMLVGLEDGIAPVSQFARNLAQSGCRVLIPVLINRERSLRAPKNAQGLTHSWRAILTNREFLYRSAFEMGRHLIGYEVQKILAGVDWFSSQPGKRPIGVAGWGEGGLLALYAAALDERLDSTLVSGYFDSRQNVWREPLDRNVFGLLEQFGDAELATMVWPRALIIEASRGVQRTIAGEGGAPAQLESPSLSSVQAEWQRAQALLQQARGPSPRQRVRLIASGSDGQGPEGSTQALQALLGSLAPEASLVFSDSSPDRVGASSAQARQQRQIDQIDRFNQHLLEESPLVRAEFMKDLDTSSAQAYRLSVEKYRRYFRDEVVGHFDEPLLEPNVRTRQAYREGDWTGYEVVLDVFPDVIAYGILLMPNDIQPGERRPVVVCQHGLEGRPQDVVSGANKAYHDFAARLAERGFITFAPQNLYIGGDRFRTLQRKANPLKKTLFSVIVPQHQQILNWLKTLPQVDPDRIGFYGLSYGGKTAMRVPPLVQDYALSICSADFNDWVWKNATTRSRYSYVFTPEYEIFEFDLGSTFNYSEMAALIAPRPFMVERGHFDGVAPDARVAHEFAKVRFLYAARLGIPDNATIEWFAGPHTIHGQGTFDFLHRHLNWAPPKE